MSARHRPLVFAGVACIFALLARSAHAGDGASADALFRQAQDAVQRGDVERACPMFAESQRLDPAPGTLLNWADCEERAGRIAQAQQLFTQATETLPARDERLAYAQERIRALAPRVPRVVLRLRAGAPPSVHVHSDGIEYLAPSFGVPLPVDPGKHTYRVDAPGYAAAEYALTLSEGESRTLDVAPGAPLADSKSAPSASSSASSSSGRAVLGFGLGAAGLVALAGGTIAGLLVAEDASTFRAHCTPGCDEEGLRAASAGRPLSIISPIALAAGAVALGIGTYLVLTSPGKAASPPRSGSRAALGAAW